MGAGEAWRFLVHRVKRKLACQYIYNTTDICSPPPICSLSFTPPKRPLKAAQAQVPSSPNELAGLFQDWFPAHWLSPADQGLNSRERRYSFTRHLLGLFCGRCSIRAAPATDAGLQGDRLAGRLGRPNVSTRHQPLLPGPVRACPRLLSKTSSRPPPRPPSSGSAASGVSTSGMSRSAMVPTASAPDTKKNQQAFPQSASQEPGCGFPLLKLVALFSLASGALLHSTIGNKHHSELQLFRRLWRTSKRGISSCRSASSAITSPSFGCGGRGVDSVLRLNEKRPRDFRRGKRLGRYDRLVTWGKPDRKPQNGHRQSLALFARTDRPAPGSLSGLYPRLSCAAHRPGHHAAGSGGISGRPNWRSSTCGAGTSSCSSGILKPRCNWMCSVA